MKSFRVFLNDNASYVLRRRRSKYLVTFTKFHATICASGRLFSRGVSLVINTSCWQPQKTLIWLGFPKPYNYTPTKNPDSAFAEPGFLLCMGRDSNNLNATRMSVAAASLMAANLYLRHPAQMQTSLATRTMISGHQFWYNVYRRVSTFFLESLDLQGFSILF